MASEALVITGPTATGKTALAIAVAHALDGEIVSMDSRQVYRGMDIGTAKPSIEERQGVPHYGFDVVDPDQRYSAGRYARDARRWIAAAQARGRVAILAGGTGFFLKALLTPLFAEPPLAEPRREQLKQALERLPSEELQRWAGRLDPHALHRGGGRQRLARAVEVTLLTGRTLGWWHANAPAREPPLPATVFVLDLPRAELYRRIDERVTAMATGGLEQEVRSLVERGYSARDPGMNATGYIELLPVIAGKRPLAAALNDVRRATRRYARRQLTWFRNQLPGAQRLDATRPRAGLVEEITATWKEEAAR